MTTITVSPVPLAANLDTLEMPAAIAMQIDDGSGVVPFVLGLGIDATCEDSIVNATLFISNIEMDILIDPADVKIAYCTSKQALACDSLIYWGKERERPLKDFCPVFPLHLVARKDLPYQIETDDGQIVPLIYGIIYAVTVDDIKPHIIIILDAPFAYTPIRVPGTRYETLYKNSEFWEAHPHPAFTASSSLEISDYA